MILPFRKYALGQIDPGSYGNYQQNVDPALDLPVVANLEPALPYSDPNDPTTWKGESEFVQKVDRTESMVWLALLGGGALLLWALSD